MAKTARTRTGARAATGPRRYEHGQDAVARPEIGAAPRFRAKAPPATYRYDFKHGARAGLGRQSGAGDRRLSAAASNDDADMTREPEMVQAYRDTWQLGLHSYLTYLRDRLLVARDY